MTDRGTTCQSPLSWETLVAYWAGDLPESEEETAELHLMSCAVCTRVSQDVSAMIDAMRQLPAAGPALRVVKGDRRDDARARAAPPPPRRRWILGAGGGALLAAAGALFLLVPRGAQDFTARLPPPVRDEAVVEIAPPRAAPHVRLEPAAAGGLAVNGARLRRIDGGWLTVRVEAGPPFAVVVDRAELTPDRYELELVEAGPDGREQSRGFYRFRVLAP